MDDFGDIGLLEALGVMTALGGQGDTVLSSSADDLMDPGGYMRAQGLDPYGRPLPNAGAKIKGAAGKATSATKGAMGKALSYADDLVTPVAKQAQLAALNATGGVGAGGATGVVGKIGRFAASPKALMLAKVGTGIGALGGVLGAADILAGNDSLGNKAMDTVAMGIGGTLGAVGGPMGIAAGAGLGKMASDATQFVLGGGKSAEQRKMEEALAALRGGQI